MPVHNSEISDVLNEVADLLEIKGENPFRIRAYRNAARTVGGLSANITDLLKQDKDLSEYEGIGKDLAGKIETIAKNGTLPLLEELRKQLPGEFSKMMQIAGLGAKKIAAIHKQLSISTVQELKEAAEQGKIEQLEGFGKKTQQNIIDEIGQLRGEESKRIRLDRAEELAEPLLKYLKKAKGLKQITPAGSYRRRKETIGDLDILVTAQKNSDIMDHFCEYEDVRKVIAKGKTKSSVLLRSDFQVDVRLLPEVSYGAAIVYFTGSKEHNIAIRKIAQKKKWKINEYGIFKGDRRIAGRTEKEIYDKLKLDYIAPELRENRGEVDAARDGKLPKLITTNDIKGDLHIHSNYTDGKNTIEEIALAARKKGYKYIAITDHSKSVRVAGGLKPKDVEKQIKEIDSLNEKLDGVVVLKGTEVDILKDGGLDLPDSILEQLDIVVCSVHSNFKLSADKQTKRIIKAMDNPHFNILGHPTGRLINERPAYEVDMEEIIKAAKDRGCFLELNAHPDRLDLNDIHCRTAKEKGVKVAISTDAHRADHLDFIRFGVGQARRGWLEANDVLNTKSLKQFKKLLKRG